MRTDLQVYKLIVYMRCGFYLHDGCVLSVRMSEAAAHQAHFWDGQPA